MKIIYLYQYFVTPKGAGATRAYEFAKRLASYGHEVHMLTSSAGWMGQMSGSENKPFSNEKWFVTDEDGIKVHWLPLNYSNYMGFLDRIKAFLKFMFYARQRAASIKADVIYATSAPLTIAIPGVHAAKKQKIPLVFEVRDLWPEAPIQMGKLNNPILRFIAKRLELYAYRNSEKVVGLSPGMVEGIRACGIDSSNVEMIPNSSDLERFAHISTVSEEHKSKYGVDGKFVFSYCGTMGEANGLHFVLDCAGILKDRGDSSISFLLVGDGKERPSLESRIISEGLSNVVLHDPVTKEEVVEVFEASDVCMTIFKNVPILRTCSPNKLFDALAAGRPILTNMPGWLGDIAENDETGCLVEPDNPNDFADKVQWMSTHSEELRQYSTNARKIAAERFDRDVLAKKQEQVLLNAIKQYKEHK